MPSNQEASQQEVLLRVEHLCQYFKTGRADFKAVDDVSFEIHKGEVFGLVGESGCGKTTTGRSIIKLYDITSGNIYFNGIRTGAGVRSYQDEIKKARKEMASADPARREELKARIADLNQEIRSARFDQKNCDKAYAKERIEKVKAEYQEKLSQAPAAQKEEVRRHFQNELRKAKKTKLITQIQMIYQDPIASLDPRKTVYETIAEGLVIRGEKDKKIIDEKVYSVLEMVGLVREHASRYPHEFSGGQRQRIGVARAIIMEPELIIADEPVSALDVSVQAQVINLLNDLRRDLGLTILFIAHDLSVVKYFSDRIGVMYYGKMVEMAPSDELFAHPLHPYTKALLSAIPLPDPLYEKDRKRIVYDPLKAHDYSVEQPTFREILPGHFIRCNSAELEEYRQELEP